MYKELTMVIINPPWNLPFLGAKGLTSPEQTATGKGISNPLMAVMVCQKPYGIQLTNVSRVNTPGSDENRLKLYDLILGDDASKQGRIKTGDINTDAEITLIDETQGRINDIIADEDITLIPKLIIKLLKILKLLDPDDSSKNHVRKFLRALPLKWRDKVTAIKEAKELATLPLDELIGNLNVYEMVLDNDGVASKTTKEKVKSLDLKAKVPREQTSDDSDSQGESDEDIDEEEVEAFNLLARNFRKFFHKDNRFGHDNHFGNRANRFGKGYEGHFASECRKPKENKAFMGGAWSDSEDGDEHQNDVTCLMAIDSKEETDIQEKEQKESQRQTNPSTEWKGQSQKLSK
ncbi:hypothetical protein Tco_0563263 [Tanacetum coccineum]